MGISDKIREGIRRKIEGIKREREMQRIRKAEERRAYEEELHKRRLELARKKAKIDTELELKKYKEERYHGGSNFVNRLVENFGYANKRMSAGFGFGAPTQRKPRSKKKKGRRKRSKKQSNPLGFPEPFW